MDQENQLLLEIWARLKTLIPAKVRLDAADALVAVWDEQGMLKDSILDEEMDKDLMAAVKSILVIDEESEDDGDYDE